MIVYQNIDAANIPFKNCFDIIVFKSILGGIGRNDNIEIQQKVFDEIYESLKPGGEIAVCGKSCFFTGASIPAKKICPVGENLEIYFNR
jgi:SAM-dependent methyltransferase